MNLHHWLTAEKVIKDGKSHKLRDHHAYCPASDAEHGHQRHRRHQANRQYAERFFDQITVAVVFDDKAIHHAA